MTHVKTFAMSMLIGGLMIASAFGQQPPAPPQAQAPFLPIVVTEADYKILTTYLMDAVPKKYADQILLWIDSLEQRAQNAAAEAAKAQQPKKDEPKKE